jgi:hypothetical protein
MIIAHFDLADILFFRFRELNVDKVIIIAQFAGGGSIDEGAQVGMANNDVKMLGIVTIDKPVDEITSYFDSFLGTQSLGQEMAPALVKSFHLEFHEMEELILATVEMDKRAEYHNPN